MNCIFDIFSDTILYIDACTLKNENDENQQTINQIVSSPSSIQFQQVSHSVEYKVLTDLPLSSPKSHDVLETETRGVDFKGNVRYFCPRCNVRYIGKAYQLIIN